MLSGGMGTIERARKFIDVNDVELWSGTRFVARPDHKVE
jgi:hypothetical protein